MIRIFLADDHTIVRQGVRKVLEDEPDFEVIGEAADGLEIADRVDRLHPDVLLLDLGLPGLNGLEVARQVTLRSPSTRIIMLTMQSGPEYVIGAYRQGAAGYLLKGSDAVELVKAVRTVAAGRRYVSPTLSDTVLQAVVNPGAADDADPYETLSDRERQVFQLMAEGLANADIGERLFISSRTVETHRTRVLKKLGLRTQTDVVRYAVRRGLLPDQ